MSRTRRTITVGKLHRQCAGNLYVAVPSIRLNGQWLEEAGFEEGDAIEVTIAQGTITLRVRRTVGMPVSEQIELF